MNAEANADLLYGVPAIAAFLQMRDKQVRHRIEAEIIPSFRIGGTVCARRSTLIAWIVDQEANARRAAA